MTARLADKVAVVAGAGTGIGRATAELFAGEGAAVPGAAAHRAAKGVLPQMTRNAAVTYVADHIRVNTVTPGIIATPGIEAEDQAITDGVIAATR